MKTVCEVTCSHCQKTFQVMRLRKGKVLCPACGRPAANEGGVVDWKAVQVT